MESIDKGAKKQGLRLFIGQGRRGLRLGPAQRFLIRRNVLLHGELGPVQFFVPPTHGQQFLVRTALHDRAVLNHEDQVRAADGGEAVCDHVLKPGADLMGTNLRSRRLCGADLRGAYLIAADLRGSDLSGVDLLGADLRDARLDGADISKALYVTQPQLNAAHGNHATVLPSDLEIPSHWPNG